MLKLLLYILGFAVVYTLIFGESNEEIEARVAKEELDRVKILAVRSLEYQKLYLQRVYKLIREENSDRYGDHYKITVPVEAECFDTANFNSITCKVVYECEGGGSMLFEVERYPDDHLLYRGSNTRLTFSIDGGGMTQEYSCATTD